MHPSRNCARADARVNLTAEPIAFAPTKLWNSGIRREYTF